MSKTYLLGQQLRGCLLVAFTLIAVCRSNGIQLNPCHNASADPTSNWILTIQCQSAPQCKVFSSQLVIAGAGTNIFGYPACNQGVVCLNGNNNSNRWNLNSPRSVQDGNVQLPVLSILWSWRGTGSIGSPSLMVVFATGDNSASLCSGVTFLRSGCTCNNSGTISGTCGYFTVPGTMSFQSLTLQ